MSNTLYIAYCKDNHAVASEIKEKLARANFDFNLLPCSNTQPHEGVNYLIANAEPQGLLLLSDNFLKSEYCMQDMLSFLQNSPKAEQMQIVVCDGEYPDGKKETTFDRVSNVIQYMNFWQERYLELRKLKRSIPDKEEDAFSQRVQIVKDISSQIGDFLRIVRNKNYWTYDQMAFNDYESFFKKYGTAIQHQNYSRLALNDPRPSAVHNQTSTKATETTDAQEKRSLTINEKLANIPPIVEEKVADISLSQEKEKVRTEMINHKDDPVEKGNKQKNKAFSTSTPSFLEEENQAIDEILNEMDSFDPDLNKESDNIQTPEELPEDLVNIYEEDIFGEADETIENDQLEELIIEDVIIEDETIEEVEEEIDPLEMEEDIIEDFDPMEDIEIEDIEIEVEEEVTDGPETFIADEVEEEEEDEDVEEDDLSYIYDEEFLEEEIEDIEEIDLIDLPDIPSPKKQMNLETAVAFMASGAHQEGTKVFEAILEAKPEDVETRFQFAKVLYQEANDPDRASSELEQIIRQHPDHIGAFRLMAEIAEHNNDFLLAKSYYEKVLSLQPDTKGINYKLALITAGFFAENPKLAARYFKKAIKEDSTNDEAHYRLATILGKQLSKREKAINKLLRCLEINPDHAEAHLLIAELLYEKQAFKAAAQHYENAWRILPPLRTPQKDAKFYAADSTDQKADQNLSPSGEKETPLKQPAVDKVVLITGATSGIGKATAHKFAAEGFRVILTGRRDDRLIQLKAVFEENFGREVKILPFDVREIDQVKEMIDGLEEHWKNIDILINNAGLAKGFDFVHDGDVEHWDTMIDTNLKGLLYMTRAVSPHMVARRSGHIINVCSTAGKEVYPKGNVYCATKHAVDALTKAMRVDLHQHNIRVGQVSPGHVEETEFAYVRFEDEERAKIYKDFKPLTSRDVAEAIFFIASAPPHVNVQDVLMTGTQQANSNFIDRSGR